MILLEGGGGGIVVVVATATVVVGVESREWEERMRNMEGGEDGIVRLVGKLDVKYWEISSCNP